MPIITLSWKFSSIHTKTLADRQKTSAADFTRREIILAQADCLFHELPAVKPKALLVNGIESGTPPVIQLGMFGIYPPESFRTGLESRQHVRVEMVGHGASVALGDDLHRLVVVKLQFIGAFGA